ncbi:MAG: hypothetical protein ACFFCW_09935 [Candidatus Hodarchaeota archaeon]
MRSHLDIQRETLEKRLAELLEEYQAASDQLGRTRDDVDRIRIERQIKELDKKMKEVNSELNKLQLSGSHQDWQKSLPRIDFANAIETFESIINQFQKDCGAVLFLIQNSNAMGGEWCITRIRDRLNEYTGNFLSCPIDVPTELTNEVGILLRLGSYVGVEPISEDSQRYANAIINKICGSVRSGSIVFIVLRRGDYLFSNEHFLPWFFNNFWIPIVRVELPKIAKKYRKVKFIVMIVADGKISSESIPSSFCCSLEQFNCEKILELPLQNWTLDEIRNWLDLFSGLTASEIDKKAEVIYSASLNGIPGLVFGALEKHLR